MENLNSNIENTKSEKEWDYYKTKCEQLEKQRVHFEERLKIEVEKREALKNQIAAFLNPIIEDKIDDVKTDLEEKVYELESRIDDIDSEVDIAEMVATELNELIRDNRLTVRLELD